MKIITIVAIILLISVVTIYLWGKSLPESKNLKAKKKINAPMDKVWTIMTDWSAQPTWREDLKKVEILDDRNFIEHPKHGGLITFKVINAQRPNHLKLRLSGSSFQGTYMIRLFDNNGATEIEETYSLIYPSILGKILVKIFFNLEEFANSYLDKLAKQAET